MRRFQRLTTLSITRAKKPGYIHDGSGLYLQVAPGGSKSWIFRFSLGGKRREMGLGPYPGVSLALARQAASSAHSLVRVGKDPIAARDAERGRKRLEDARAITFDQAAEQFIAANEPGWRNATHCGQWRTSLAAYASPVIGEMSVADIGVTEVMRVLEPL